MESLCLRIKGNMEMASAMSLFSGLAINKTTVIISVLDGFTNFAFQF